MDLQTVKAKLAEQSATENAPVQVRVGDKTYRVTEIRTEVSGQRGETVLVEVTEAPASS